MGATLERELGSGGDLLTSATSRAAALARAHERCGGVVAPSRVWRRPDGMVAVAFPVAVGASLAELRRERALTLGECVTIGVGLADCLAAMHAERVAHGDVSAANVMASGRRIALVDTMSALCPERGTPGFAPPERSEGASPAGDVFALGMVLRHVADADAGPVIEAWTAPLLAADPHARPTAAHAAAAIARCAPSAPVRAPEAPVAAAMRASAVPRTAPCRRDRGWRAQKAAVKLAPLVGLAVVAAMSGAALVPAVARNPDPLARGEPHVEAPVTIPVATGAFADPEHAAVDLARRRVEALSQGDGRALLAISAPGSAAAGTDAATAAALADGDLRFHGLALDGASATLVKTTPSGAVVTVTSALGPYNVGPEAVGAGEATATLELVLTQRGWLVARILPQP